MSTYKGIDKEAILKIKEVRFPQVEKDIDVDLTGIEDSFDIVRKALEAHQKMLMNDTEMSIICEMAMKYLDEYESREENKAEAYNKGLEDAWELAKKIVVDCKDMTGKEFQDIFGYYLCEVFVNYTPQEALAKLEAYEKAQVEIKVGDVLKARLNGMKCVVSSDKGCNGFVLTFPDGSGATEDLTFIKQNYKKTGKHIDIQSVLEQIGGAE